MDLGESSRSVSETQRGGKNRRARDGDAAGVYQDAWEAADQSEVPEVLQVLARGCHYVERERQIRIVLGAPFGSFCVLSSLVTTAAKSDFGRTRRRGAVSHA